MPDPRPYAARVPDVDPPIGDSETITATSMISGTSTSGVSGYAADFRSPSDRAPAHFRSDRYLSASPTT